MYWFTKRLRLPASWQIARYLDSDDYLFNSFHKFKVQDKLDDFNRKRIHDKFKDSRLKEASELYENDSSFLEELIEHQKYLTKFNEYHKKHKFADEEHVEFVKKDYKNANTFKVQDL